MSKTEYQTSLAVSDFVRPADDESAREVFNRAENAVQLAIDEARREVQSVLGDDAGAVAIAASFLECDSRNISHANAYYRVTLEGPRELPERFLDGWFDDEDVRSELHVSD